MTARTRLALTIGLIVLGLSLIGVALGRGPFWPFFLLALLILASALLEPLYGRLVGRSGLGHGAWRPSGERFIDPETGRLVEVWFEPSTGERRYVAVDD